MGEIDGNAIYFDTKQNQPLKARKSMLLDSEKTKNNARYIIYIILILLMIGGTVDLFMSSSGFYGEYTMTTLLKLSLMWFFEFICCVVFVHRILYRNVKHAIPASKKEFGLAIRNNNIWNMFSNKKVTTLKKIFAWILTGTILFTNIGFIYILDRVNQDGHLLGYMIGNEIFMLSLFGFLLFILYYLIWENNLIRWFGVVDKYQKRKLGE